MRNRKKLCIILIVNIYSCEFYFVICTIEMNNLMKEILLYILYTNSYAVVKIDQFFIMYSDLYDNVSHEIVQVDLNWILSFDSVV